MNKLNLRLIFAAAMLVAIPVIANASQSRIEGLGVNGDFVKDYSSINGWPSTVNGVGSLAYVELGNGAGQMGAVLPNLWDGKFGVWSIQLNEVAPALGGYEGLGDPNFNPSQQYDITWGKKLSSMTLGINLNRSFWSIDNNTTKGSEAFRNASGLGIGLSFNTNERTNADVALHYSKRTFTVGNNTDNGNASYLLQGRMMYKWQPTVTIVPVIKFYSFDNGQKNPSVNSTVAGWSAGLAGNWALGSNDLFVFGVNFDQNTVEDNSDGNYKHQSNNSPAAFMALESQVNNWLTLRFGVNKDVFHSEKNTAGSTDRLSTGYSLTTGAGVKVGALQFDATLGDGFYNTPVANIMGNQHATDDLFSHVTATYAW